MYRLSNKFVFPGRLVVVIVALVPWITLLIILLKSDQVDHVIQALRGEYYINGILHNPIRDFLPLFLLTNLAATGFAYGASLLTTARRLSITTARYRIVGVAVFVLLSAVLFTFALGQAAVADCLFRDNFMICSADPMLALVTFVCSFLILLLFNLIRLRVRRYSA